MSILLDNYERATQEMEDICIDKFNPAQLKVYYYPVSYTHLDVYKRQFLDMTEISEEIISNMLSGLADDCMTYLHNDIRQEPVSVLPGFHYFMGGILEDEHHRTPIQNLYAAGELSLIHIS